MFSRYIPRWQVRYIYTSTAVVLTPLECHHTVKYCSSGASESSVTLTRCCVVRKYGQGGVKEGSDVWLFLLWCGINTCYYISDREGGCHAIFGQQQTLADVATCSYIQGHDEYHFSVRLLSAGGECSIRSNKIQPTSVESAKSNARHEGQRHVTNRCTCIIDRETIGLSYNPGSAYEVNAVD